MCGLAAMNEDDDDDEPMKFNVTEEGMKENSEFVHVVKADMEKDDEGLTTRISVVGDISILVRDDPANFDAKRVTFMDRYTQMIDRRRE